MVYVLIVLLLMKQRCIEHFQTVLSNAVFSISCSEANSKELPLQIYKILNSASNSRFSNYFIHIQKITKIK